MVWSPKPPKVDVGLYTVEAHEIVLRRVAVPVKRQWILDALRTEDAALSKRGLNRALQYLFRHGWAIEGSKGVQWTRSEGPTLALARLIGRRL